MSAKRILITGIGGYWGSRVALKLVEHPEYHVMGLDTIAPKEPIPGLDFIQADIVTIIQIAVVAHRDIEIQFIVDTVGVGAAHIVRHA